MVMLKTVSVIVVSLMPTVMVYCCLLRYWISKQDLLRQKQKKSGTNYDRQMKISRRQLNNVISIAQKRGNYTSLSNK